LKGRGDPAKSPRTTIAVYSALYYHEARIADLYSSFQLDASSPAGSAGVSPARKAPKLGALLGRVQVQTAVGQ